MVRTAIRALSLNVYHGELPVISLYSHFYVADVPFFYDANLLAPCVYLEIFLPLVGDVSVNRFVASPPHSKYFSNLVKYFCKQCLELSELVSDAL